MYIYSFWGYQLASLDKVSLKNILVLNANSTYKPTPPTLALHYHIASHPLDVRLIGLRF